MAVCPVQVMPSGLVMTRLDPELLTATKSPLPYVTDRHKISPGMEVWLVQVMPSGLVMTSFPLLSLPTATKSPFPYVTELHV